MLFRLVAAMLAAPLVLAGPAIAREPSAKPAAEAKAAAEAREPSVSQSAARARQKKCGAEWRTLSTTEKSSQGPKWPQYYSKCVKRLKEVKA